MNDQAANVAAAELLAWVKGAATDAQGFIIEQAPLYAQEVVAYERWFGTLGAIVCALAFVLCAKAFTVAIRSLIKRGDPEWIVVIMLSAILGIPSLVGFAVNSTGAIKAWTAPRMVVVEHMRGLVR